nr:hypothetical protein [Curtobacterium sp. VKM Ac-2887]
MSNDLSSVRLSERPSDVVGELDEQVDVLSWRGMLQRVAVGRSEGINQCAAIRGECDSHAPAVLGVPDALEEPSLGEPVEERGDRATSSREKYGEGLRRAVFVDRAEELQRSEVDRVEVVRRR